MTQERTALQFQLPSSVFLAEWGLVAAFAGVDAIWAYLAGLSFSFSIGAVALPGIGLALALALRSMHRFEGGALIFEYVALMTAMMHCVAVLTYLCAAVDRPLADAQLLGFDHALGLDWLYWFHALQARPLLYDAFGHVYHSLIYQALYFTILFGLMRQRERLREMFWIVVVGCLITSAGSVLVPALGTFKAFGLERLGAFIPVMEQLRAGTDLHFVIGRLTGIVTFPSFHTTMALVYVYGFRDTGIIGRAMLAFNAAMLLTIPFIGGHHFVDMLAGAIVALGAIALVRRALAAPARSRAGF